MANEHPFGTSQQSVTGPAHPESRSIGATTHYINARAWSIGPKVSNLSTPSLGSNYFCGPNSHKILIENHQESLVACPSSLFGLDLV